MHLLACSAASRTIPKRRRRSSTVPWEALSRTTSSPARIISVRTAMSSVAGPTVATIFVRLNMDQLLARSSSAATAGSFLPSTNSRKAPPPVEI